MTALIIFLALFLVYYALKHQRIILNRKFELRLFHLRDKVREMAIAGEINKNDWTFNYYDSSISKMTSQIKMMNIWHAMYLAKTHKNDEKLKSFQEHLNQTFAKNANYKKIQQEYIGILREYMFEKHFFFLSIVLQSLVTTMQSINLLKQLKQNAANSVRKLSVLPETSTSDLYFKKLRIA
jgi:hypothetical protein